MNICPNPGGCSVRLDSYDADSYDADSYDADSYDSDLLSYDASILSYDALNIKKNLTTITMQGFIYKAVYSYDAKNPLRMLVTFIFKAPKLPTLKTLVSLTSGYLRFIL